MSDKEDFIYLLKELNSLYLELNDEELIVFVGYLSELDDIPLRSNYSKWNIEFLNNKLKKIDIYKKDIIESANLILLKYN